MSELRSRIAGEIADHGPMPFSRFMELALYTPDLGFYETSGQAGGRRGDFVTSVEAGPLFAAVIGDWLDGAWDAAGQPSHFRVAEAAAGVGTLWRGVVKAAPRCIDALEWILVERSATLRATHATLPPGATSAPDLPETPVHVVLANELLDNLVFDIAIRVDDGATETQWMQRLVDDRDGTFVFVTGEWDGPAPESLPDPAPASVQLPVPVGADDWLKRARSIGDRVLMFDYAADDATLLKRGLEGWLRCYQGHRRIADALSAPGEYDITHDVPVDRLPAPTALTRQAAWLRAHGLAERVEMARKTWQERSHIGDLEAMFARSAVHEADALTDPDGLGGFAVMEWVRDQGG